MNSKGSQTRWLVRLSASLVAASLPLTSTNCAYANADRAATQLNHANARANWQASRQEARDARRDLRIENHAANNGLGHSHTGTTPNIAIDPIRTNIERGNTAILFPGQVSTFHTSRPNQFSASTYINDGGKTRAVTRGVSLDLSSIDANITVGKNLLDGSTTIQVGDETKTISAGSKVTAAEYAALNQKLATGSQALNLSSAGAAEGGSVNLNLVSDDGSTIRASELVVPKNVTVTGDFARSADGVRVTKDVVNYGTLVATSSNANANTAIIGARDINNELGASISSQSTATNPALNLALRADRDLNNDGSITSAGSLELSAGRSINNHGLLSATAGDVTFSAPNDGILSVNNTGGTVSAANGAINVRAADYNGTANSTVYGGNFYSKELNLNAGQATANLTANEVTGVVNTSGLAAHVSTNTSTLVLGKQCLTGDPTYFNTGDIIIGGDIIVGEDLAIIAGGNITTNQTSLIIRARDGLGQGDNINIIAGTNITAGAGQVNPPGGPATLTLASQAATSTVTVSGGSAGGGSVDLSGASTSLLIDSSSNANDFGGGSVTIAAFFGGTNFGQIVLPGNSTIQASGIGAGNNGNVTIVADAPIIPGIELGTIINNAGGGTNAGTGIVTISNTRPTSSNGSAIDFGTNGSITSGNTVVPSTNFGGGHMGLGQIQAREVRISASSVDVGQINADAQVSITSQFNVNLNGNITAKQALAVVAGVNITGNGITIDTSNATGPGGSVVMASGANFTEDNSSITVLGPSNILSGISLLNTAINTSTANSSGGNVTLVAFADDGGHGGAVAVTTGQITTGGLSNSNGFVNIIGGNNDSGTAVVVPTINTTGGTNSTGQVIVLAATPQLAGPISKTTGLYTGTFVDQSALTNGLVQINGPIRTNADVFVQTKGNLAVQVVQSNFSGTGSAGNVNLLSGVSSSLNCLGVDATGVGTGNGGNISVTGGTSLSLGNLFSDGGNGGIGVNAGNISVTASLSAPMTMPSFVSAQGLGSQGGGGTFSLTNLGSGGINLDSGSFNISGIGNSGSVFFNANAGPITKTSGLSYSAVAGQAGFNDGTISLVGTSINISGGVVIINAQGSGSNAGSGFVQIGTTTGDVKSNGNGFIAVSSGDIFVNLNGHDLNPSANFGSFITLDAKGNLSVTGRLITTPTGAGNAANGMTLNAGPAGGISINTIKTDGNGSGNAGIVNFNAGSGGITVGTITADSAGGSKGSVQFTTTDGDISVLGSVSAGALQVNMLGTTGGTATISGNVNTLGASATGVLNFDAGSNPIVIAPSGIFGNVTVVLTTTDATVGILNANSIGLTSPITMNTPKLTNTGTIDADSILVQSVGNLTIDGGVAGAMTGHTPSAGTPGNPSNPAAIRIVTGNAANLNLAGNMTFTGDVLLNNPNGTTTSGNSSVFTGTNNITLNTLTYTQNPGGLITANKFIFSGLSIVNPDGDVLLPNLVVNGRDLVIAAFHDVLFGSFVVDTSSSTGDGGDVTIIAGYNLTPFGGGQGTTQDPYIVTGPATLGGSIKIAGAGSVNTSSTGATGNAGNILAVANIGTITLGNLTATGGTTSGKGGNVNLIGATGVTAGNITTTGPSGDGSVVIDGSAPVIIPSAPLTITAGVITGGTFASSGSNTGPISVGSISAGQSSIDLNAAGQSVGTSGTLSANQINIKAASLNFSSTDTLTAVPSSVTQIGGTINLVVDNPVTVNGSTFKIEAKGGFNGDGGSISYITKSDLDVGGQVTIDASGAGAGGKLTLLTDGNLTIGNGGITVFGSVGNGAIITIAAGANDDTGTLTINDVNFLGGADAHLAGDGGRIDLSGQFISMPTSNFTFPVVLHANGADTGNGGTIKYVAFEDQTPVFVGIPVKAPKLPATFLSFQAQSGANGGDGGTIFLETGGNITANATDLTAGPRDSSGNWDGASITLTAGKANNSKAGSLIITGSLNADGVNSGSGGTINLEMNNKKAFVIDPTKTPKNGIFGTLSAAVGGEIQVENRGGGITVAGNGATNDQSDVDLRANLKGGILVHLVKR